MELPNLHGWNRGHFRVRILPLLAALAVFLPFAAWSQGNTPPTISAISNLAINEDGNTGPLAFIIGDAESNLNSLILGRASDNTSLVPTNNIVFGGGGGANRTVTVTPVANGFGSALITLSVSDGTNVTSTSFTLTVNPINDPPTIGAISASPIDEDTSTGPIAFTIGDVDNDPNTLLLTAASSNTTLVPTNRIAFGGSGTSRTVTVTPATNENGSAVITITVSDGSLSTNRTFTLTVNPVNDTPRIVGTMLAQINDNAPTNLFASMTIVDVDHTRPGSEILTLTVTVGAGGEDEAGTFDNGETSFSLTNTPPNVTSALQARTFFPRRNRLPTGSNEVVSVTMTLADSQVASPDNGGRNLSILSVNDAPVITVSLVPATTPDTQPVQPFRLTVNDPDANEAFTVTIEPVNDTNFLFGVLEPATPQFTGSQAAVEAAMQTVFYRPVRNSALGNQPVQFLVRVTDAHGGTASTTTQLTVTGFNDPPDIVGVTLDLIRIRDDEFVFPFSEVRVEDPDLGGQQPVTVTLALDDPSKGTFSPPGPFTNLVPARATDALRAVKFIPNPDRIPLGETETATLTITARDALGLSRSDNRTRVAVTSVNSPPRIDGVPDLSGQPVLRSPAPPIRPFIGVSITDDDRTNVTVTVTLDNPAKGGLTNLGGFVQQPPNSGSYRFTGLPTNATTALQNLAFQINPSFPFPPSAPGGTAFTIQAIDSALNTTTKILSILIQNEPRNHMVTRAEDDFNPGSLRHALTNVENNGVITFALPSYPAVIRLETSNGPINLARNVGIKGPGADRLTISGDTDGNGTPDVQLFRVNAFVGMEGFTVAHGTATTGGAIYVGPSGNLVMRFCAVVHSRADHWGGGIDVDQGALAMEACLMRGNATDPASGLGGGAVSIYTDRPCSFVNTTFSGNRQQAGSGFGGGAIYAENFTPSTELSNLVAHCTFAENVDASGQGSSIHANVFGTVVRVMNSIFGDGQGRNLEVRGAGRIVSLDGNISDDAATTTLTQGGQPNAIILLDQTADARQTNPMLLPLSPLRGPTSVYPLQAGSPAIGRAVDVAPAIDQRGVIRDSDPDSGAVESGVTGRLVINEIQARAGSTNFLELSVLRDSTTPVDLSGYSLWLNGTNIHLFGPGTVVQPGFGILVAGAVFPLDPTNNPTPLVIASGAPLALGERGLIELRKPAIDGRRVLSVAYLDRFVDPSDPANTNKYAGNSMTLAPQFAGFALLPHSTVLPGPLGGADLSRIASANRASPGSDSSPTPFGSPNAFPVAVADEVLVGEDDMMTLRVLDNDIDADGLDRLVIIDVSPASDPGTGGTAVTNSLRGALVSVDPSDLPLRGAAIIYNPGKAAQLQRLAIGAKATDEFYYEVIDIGTGPIDGYGSTNGGAAVTVVSPAHRLTNGVRIVISDAGVPGYNGEHPVTRIDDDRFSIPVAFVTNPPVKGAWVTRDPRVPSQRKEARVLLTVLGANDPPLLLTDTVTNVTEESITRILGDTNLIGSGTTFDTDGLYAQTPQVAAAALLQNDSDPDTDDDRTTLKIVGVVERVNPIAGYVSTNGGTAVIVQSTNHGLANGTVILISSYGGHPSYNGFQAVTVLNSDEFSIPVRFIDNDPEKGVWAVLNDGNRLSAISRLKAAVTLEIRADRNRTSVIYNPRNSTVLDGLALGETAFDSFYYAAEDRHGAVSLGLVMVEVAGLNDTPRPMADPPSLSALQASLQGQSLGDFIAQLRVLYRLKPASGKTNRADVQVQSGAAGFFLGDLLTTDEESALLISSASLIENDSDVDRSDVLRVGGVVSLSRQGAAVGLSGDGATITYNPAASARLNSLARGEMLIDTFDVTISDGRGGSATSLVAVLVVGLNDTPVARADLNQTLKNQVLVFDPILHPTNNPSLHDTDADIDGSLPDNRLVLIPVTNATTLVTGVHYSITGNQITYNPTNSTFLDGLGQGETFNDKFRYTVMDGSFIFANDDLFKVEADGAGFDLNVLANDRNLTGAGGALRVIRTGTPNRGGTVTTNGAGTRLIYTPEISFVGEERFTYTVSDRDGNIDSALVTVRVTVNQFNGNLRANADAFTVARGESPVLDVLANDNLLPASGASLTVTRIVAPPARDRVAVVNNRIVYTQEAAGPFPYTESFTYEVSGGGTARATATVVVQVVDRQGTLNVRDDVFSVVAGTLDNSLDVLANDHLLPGAPEALTIRGVSGSPANGSVRTNSGGRRLLYTPANGFVGEDVLAYVATDRLGGTGTGVVRIAVGTLTTASDFFAVPFNDPSTSVDDGPIPLDVLGNDRVLQGTTGTNLVIVAVTPTNTTIGAMGLNTNGTRLLFVPAEGEEGEMEFSYTIGDGSGRTAVGRVTVVVVREGVKANADFYSVAADSAANQLDVLGNDAAIPDRGRRLAIMGIGTGVDAPNRGGTVVVNTTADGLIYTPAPGFSGEETFTYTMTDSQKTDTARVVVNVTSGALSANDDALTVFLDPVVPSRPFTLPVLANDRVLPDLGQQLTITVVGFDDVSATNAPANRGQVQISPDNLSLVYVPGETNGPFPYVERIAYEITDGTTRRSRAVVVVEVLKRVNARDLETNDDRFSVRSSSSNNVLVILANDNVRPATATGWTITGVGPRTFNGVVVIQGGNLLYTPQPGFVGTDTFSYGVSDGFGGTGHATVWVEIGDLPVCDDLFTVLSGSLLNELDVIANDAIRPATASSFMLLTAGGTDRNGIAAVLTNRVTVNPANGLMVTNRIVLYSPDPAYTGSYPYVENFSYAVQDDSMGIVTGRAAVVVHRAGSDRAEAEVTITVVGVNDSPVISGTVAGQTVYERGSIRPFAGVTISDVDTFGTQPQVVTVSLDGPNKGFIVPSGGFVDAGGGTYVLGSTGAGVSPAAATAALRGLVFVPTTADRVTQNTPETTRLTIQVNDGIAPVVVDDKTTVIAVDAFMRKVLAGDGQASDQFGSSVAATRDVVVVGAPLASHSGIRSGAVYVYERNPGGFDTWVQVKKLVPVGTPGSFLFGNAVAIHGDTIVVGAMADFNSSIRSGTVYVFERHQGGTNQWGLVKKLAPADGANDDQFGYAVAIDLDTLVSGARFDDDRGANSGSAYVHSRHQGGTNQWGFVRKIVPADGVGGDEFGSAVGISEDTVVVGARLDDDRGTDSGSAYVFGRDQGGSNQWSQVRKLLAADGAAQDQFGVAVAIDAGVIVVGSSLDDDRGLNSGSAYVFARDHGATNGWGQLTKLLPVDGAAGDSFGFSVSIDGPTIIIGAPMNNQMGANAGAAYVFRTNQAAMPPWVQVDKLLPDATSANGEFGRAVSVSRNTVAVGARSDDDRGASSGSASIFRLKFNNPPQVSRPIPDLTAIEGVPLLFAVPVGTFADPDIEDSFSLSAGPSPAWLQFNPLTRTFSGTPSASGVFLVSVLATDENGASVAAPFGIVVINGGGPLIPALVPLLRVANSDPNHLEIAFHRLSADSALNYALEFTVDLVNWSPADALIQSRSVVASVGATEEVRWSLLKSIFPGSHGYFRVVVRP